MTYPIKRALKCLEDPTLYFSLLVRDIRDFYLRPLLSNEHAFQLCDQSLTPKPIYMKGVPIHHPIHRFNLLINGQVLYHNCSAQQLIVFDLTIQLVVWSKSIGSNTSFCYDRFTDTLICQLPEDQSVYLEIPFFSQSPRLLGPDIKKLTPDEFHYQVEIIRRKRLPIMIPTWYYDQVISTDCVYGRIYQVSFYGGYLIALRNSNSTFQFELYRCILAD